MAVSTEADRIGRALEVVRGRIEDACVRVGREPEEVTLLAVSKRHPVACIAAALSHGQRDFGENYVQELVQKARALAAHPDVRFHLIGHLQRNKVRDAVAHSAVVQTVDSIRLAETLGGRAAREGAALEAFVQVNVAGEAQKSGCTPEDLPAVLDAVRAQASLTLRGLMTVPPWDENPEAARPHFRRLRMLAEAHGLRGLSMGMSHDLEVAIEEGATLVRVGTAIFGPRPVPPSEG